MESESCDFTFITYSLEKNKNDLKEIDRDIKELKRKLKNINIKSEWIVVLDENKNSDQLHLKYADIVINNEFLEGFSYSKNKAIHQSTGSWIISVDEYDRLNTKCINLLTDIISQPESVGWVISNTSLPDNIETNEIKKGSLTDMLNKNILEVPYSNNVVFKKEALVNHTTKGWLNLPSHEDIGTTLVISELYKGVFFSNQLLISYPFSDKSIQSKLQILNKPFSFEKISEIINKIRHHSNKEKFSINNVLYDKITS